MTTQPTLGQRLREWRKARGLTPEEAARRLGITEYFLCRFEHHADRIEALIGPPLTAEEQQMVDRVVQAVRNGYVVSLIRPMTVDAGQIVLTFGDDE